ncbi:hypothetical protein GCM10020256_74420 [Streptomyces thermocoprophilus]
MEVDQAAFLVFSDLRIRHLHHRGEAALGEAADTGDLAAEVEDEPGPEDGRVGVPQDRALVVVAFRVQW